MVDLVGALLEESAVPFVKIVAGSGCVLFLRFWKPFKMFIFRILLLWYFHTCSRQITLVHAVTLSLKQTSPMMTSAQISKFSSASTIFSNSLARLTCYKTKDCAVMMIAFDISLVCFFRLVPLMC